VTFYNDAAIMLPDSREELTGLLDMMRENPNYKIRLHGHTNGNYNGKIIKIGDNKNFFSLDGSKSTMGTAKDLSYERAEVIKEYLVANGIDGTRMEVKGWGGKKPLFDKNSVNAKRNVRVEVEIVSN
jgi:outer membrane protein OmpA-like peptidoglycan-associated protein